MRRKKFIPNNSNKHNSRRGNGRPANNSTKRGKPLGVNRNNDLRNRAYNPQRTSNSTDNDPYQPIYGGGQRNPYYMSPQTHGEIGNNSFNNSDMPNAGYDDQGQADGFNLNNDNDDISQYMPDDMNDDFDDQRIKGGNGYDLSSGNSGNSNSGSSPSNPSNSSSSSPYDYNGNGTNYNSSDNPPDYGLNDDSNSDDDNSSNGDHDNVDDNDSDSNNDSNDDQNDNSDDDRQDRDDSDNDEDSGKDKDDNNSDSDDSNSDNKGKDSDNSDSDGQNSNKDGNSDSNDPNSDNKNKDKNDKDEKDGKDDDKTQGSSLKDKLNPLNKLKRKGKGKKKFKDFLKKQKRKNAKDDKEKLKRLTTKLARAIQRFFNLLRIYMQAMRLFALYKLMMALKAIISWVTNIVMSVVTFVTTIVSTITSFFASLGAMLWAWLIAGAVLFGVLGALLFMIIFAGINQQKQNALYNLYQSVCVNDDNKSKSSDDDSGGGGEATKGNGKKVKLKPLKFKDYKDNRKEAISISKAVAKKAGIPTAWAFAQIYAEESTFITGGDLQPVVTKDHNLTGMGPVGVSFGTGHAEGDGGYGHYDNYHQFAAAWAYTLNQMVPSKKYKKNARTYVARLKSQGYFTAPLSDYWNNFSSGLANYKSGKGAGGAASATGSENSGSDGESAFDKAKDAFCDAIKPKADASGKWGWPFKGLTYSKIKAQLNGGAEFGNTSMLRRSNPPSYFHDGIDLGTSQFNHMKIRAIHDGVVKKIGFEGHTQHDLGGYVWVHNPKDGYNVIYQEFVFSTSDKSKAIKVKVGDHVKVGDTIGILSSSNTSVTHVHIGVTKSSFNEAISHSFDDDGTWLNPVKLIHEGIKNGGSGGSGDDPNPDHLSKSELAARAWIVKRESHGDWNTVNPSSGTYGRYQLSKDKIRSEHDKSHKRQTEIADKYVKGRYGSWKNAKKYWEKHGSY